MRSHEFIVESKFYHGTNSTFDQFDSTSSAYWFTPDQQAAQSQGNRVISATLDIKNPYRWQQGDPEPDTPAFINQLKSQGYDSIIAPSNISVDDDYIVFSPKQIHQDVNEEVVSEGFIPDYFRNRLAKQGYKFLGQGVDQAAFTVPGKPNLVLKIFGYGEYGDDSSHKMFFRWAKFSQKNSSNPFLPKFGGFQKVKIDDETYIMMYQERLTHNKVIGNAVADLAESVYPWIDPREKKSLISDAKDVLEPRGIDVNALIKTLSKLYKIGETQGYDWDMHSYNVMVRANGQPVLVDPWV